jgi:catechol 2,3-dioxygenase-like lactoylglutathione lyase family enzyme
MPDERLLPVPLAMPAHTGGMLGHIGINVPDLELAKEYYGELMPLLGFESFFAADDEFSFMPSGGKRGTLVFIYPAREPTQYSRHSPGLQHLAFMVPTRSAVHAVHAKAVELGSEVLNAPQPFPQYPPPYYATFWTDPFGFMLEAVCHHDRD